MKAILFKTSIALAGLTAIFSTGCTGNGYNNSSELTTDSIAWTKTVNEYDSNAFISLTGYYPTGGNRNLTDSIGMWIADCLTEYDPSGNKYSMEGAPISDGEKLLSFAGERFAKIARNDFKELSKENIALNYEWQVHFNPEFVSDSIITYHLGSFYFLGGAHGNSDNAYQSFIARTGQRLTYANIFVPGYKTELKPMLEKALWEQYFKADYSDDDAEEPITLYDVLTVYPGELPQPVIAPAFMADGMEFSYQIYEISSYAAGQPYCIIPYSEIMHLLTPEVQKLISDL